MEMAIIKVLFICGCGWRSPEMEEAQVHADTTGHCLHAQGEIRSSQDKKAKERSE